MPCGSCPRSLAVLAVAAAAWSVERSRTLPAGALSARVRAHRSRTARNHDLDPALLAAVVYVESRFDPDVESPAGAIGLMQLLPDTAKGIALRTGGDRFVVADLRDPEINVRYGSWYLDHLRERYDGTRFVLAAYHAGQGNVDRWREDGTGIPFPETRSYVAEVMRLGTCTRMRTRPSSASDSVSRGQPRARPAARPSLRRIRRSVRTRAQGTLGAFTECYRSMNSIDLSLVGRARLVKARRRPGRRERS